MKDFLQSHLNDFLLILIILLIAFYVWYPLTQFALTGLGFIYLSKYFQAMHFSGVFDLASFYWFAIVQGIVYSNLFTTNMSLYFWTELIVMFGTFIFFYILILTLLNNRLIAFIATLMFSVNFFGSIDMFASGIYPWFQERIPLMLLLIPSFLFLHKYLIKKDRRYIISSLILYFLGLGIGHWGVLFTAPYFFYPFFWAFFQKPRKFKYVSNMTFVGGIYLLISVFFIFIQNLILPAAGPYWGFMEFLLQPGNYQYPEKIFRQLVYWSSYSPIFEIMKNGLPLYPPSPLYFFINPADSMRYAGVVAIVYTIVSLIIYLKLPKYRALLLTVIISVLSMFYLNAYFGRYEILNQPGSNRYLYLPTYLLVIFWSLFLVAIFQKNKGKRDYFYKFKILFCFISLTIYLFFNTWLIKDALEWKLEIYDVTNKLWEYTVKKSNKLKKNTLVILPFGNFDQQGAAFLNEQINDIIFTTSADDWRKVATSSSVTNILKIEYDEFCKCAKEIKINKASLK